MEIEQLAERLRVSFPASTTLRVKVMRDRVDFSMT